MLSHLCRFHKKCSPASQRRAHRRAELADSDLHPDCKLAPRSPFLNPIENMISVLKADLEQRLSYVQDRLDDRAAAQAAGNRGLVTWRSLFFHPVIVIVNCMTDIPVAHSRRQP